MTGLEMLQQFGNEIYGYEYHEIIQEFSKIFVAQCGSLEYDNILKRISNSNSFSKMNSSSKLNHTYVNEKSIIGPLLLIPHFIFKGGYTQYLASLFALERWNQEVNNFTRVQSERELADVAISMFLYISNTRGFKV